MLHIITHSRSSTTLYCYSAFLHLHTASSAYSVLHVSNFHDYSLSLSLSLSLSHTHTHTHTHSHTCTHTHLFYIALQRIYQNRISITTDNKVSIEIFEVEGLASVELELTRPTYLFDCNTTLNNGTGIRWTHQGGFPTMFRVEPIPSNSNGQRLTAAGITADDLGVYTCLDTYSNTSVPIHITQGCFFSSYIHFVPCFPTNVSTC